MGTCAVREGFVAAQVVMALQNDARFLPDLFARLKASGPDDEGWADQVAFLQELTGLTKHLQQGNRQQLLTKLANLGLFEVTSLSSAESPSMCLPPCASQPTCAHMDRFPGRI